MTLDDTMRRRGNNLDFLRFFAATMVILSHSFAFVCAPEEYFGVYTGWSTGGTFGVCIFFTISGFLITKSWEDDPRLLAFLKKRFLRIFPGLLGATLFCVFVIGPLATSLPLRQYFQNQETLHYFWSLFLFGSGKPLPGVFANNHYPLTVNGSLWTLPIELLCYALVVALGGLGILKSRNTPVVLLLGLFYLNANFTLRPDPSSFVAGFILGQKSVQNCYTYFLIGMICYQYRHKIILSGPICLLLLLATMVFLRSPHIDLVVMAALPYTVFYIAYAALPSLNGFSKYGDFSYGLYIYAFPIQQLTVRYLGNNIAWYTLFGVSLVPILAVSVLSWYAIEKPALRLKSKREPKVGELLPSLFIAKDGYKVPDVNDKKFAPVIPRAAA